ncbi:MAG: HAMP domain-containing protein, partial [Candidatus Bathyarchaeia archaeon]
MDEYSSRQLQRLLEGLEAVRRGDLTFRIRKEREDVFGELADSYNGMVELIGGLADEVSRVATVAGEKGKLDERASVPQAKGSWKAVVDTLNSLIDSIQTPVKEVQRVLTAISQGDLTTKIAMEAAVGDFRVMADTVNKTVDDLNRLASEVSRVARVAGEEGGLTERARVEGVAGSWKVIVDTLNALIDSIARPVLEVRRIMTAISEGDLTQKVQIPTAGDIKVLSDVINKTVDDLNRLAGEVARVARVAGVEGKLSERARVEGVKGSWK